ncbi:Glyoxalase/Bleomycin resistance protein/Dioxygenase superfamily protein [Paenibacillus catalpae]|uniref:Glyoxalase/Bleomycin resistance protein/Dioxygenase superfamily protein n=1 Tax=Paenibacillus catalpae TaxID=1045775 RepID=A0A1I1UMA2_9BACL|nr:VOC family protein [Paenibacillus catalpae]SFD71715.1 Glyoxalase/Bleomycin resistance protein/Dioxygenase superfamily protein [Paenibacillus catalpae]
MGQSAIGTKMITQIGILVHDIEAVSEAYANFFGVDKPAWNWTDTPDKAQTEFLGEPSQARAKLAFIDMDSLQLELIEPDFHPSTWRNYLEEHGEGPHHIAFVIEGMKEKIAIMESKGMKLQQKGEYTGGRYAYFDSIPQLKVLVELLENDK